MLRIFFSHNISLYKIVRFYKLLVNCSKTAPVW